MKTFHSILKIYRKINFIISTITLSINRDLRPDNILLGEKGHLMVTYMCHFTSVDSVIKEDAVRRLYTAPEVNSIFPVTTSADWWSFGAIIFELCSGKVIALLKKISFLMFYFTCV